MDAFIVEGDATSHGGRVINCSPISLVNGRPIARLGDMATCPKCGGVYPIVTSRNPGMNMMGKPVAFDGDRTACGATLIGSQSLASAKVPMGAGGTGAGAATATHESAEGGASPYRGRFQVLDEATGQPVAGHPYTLRTADGRTLSGTTDASGHTAWHEADSPASLQFASASPSETGAAAGAGSGSGSGAPSGSDGAA